MIIFLKGIGLGIVFAFLIGPVFFALLQTSIHKGFRAGAYLAVGIFLSDSLYATIAYVGVSELFSNAGFETGLGWVGGALMLFFGISALVRRPKTAAPDLLPKSNRIPTFRFILKGFFLNVVNPSVPMIWLGIVSGTVKDGYTRPETLLYLAGILLTIITTDLLKVYLARRLSRYLTPKLLIGMNRVVGLALIGYGLRLLWGAWHG